MKTKLIGSFLTCQMKVKVYKTDIELFDEQLYVCKTTVRNKTINGRKGGIYFGTKKQMITFLRPYGKPAEAMLTQKFDAVMYRARFTLEDSEEAHLEVEDGIGQ